LRKLEKWTIGSWEELTKQFTSNFRSTYKRPTSIEEVKACVQQRNETLRAYIQRWSIIKKISSRSIKRKSNRRFHARVATRRPSWGDGQNQAEDSIRFNGYSKQICRWWRYVQQQMNAVTRRWRRKQIR
jgi:hypothetical protein